MPRFNEYYIVEYRFPIRVDSVSSIQEVMSIASQIFSNQYGFKPDNWNARIFKYSTEANIAGQVEEYFYNPNSSSIREIKKNLSYHSELIEKGEIPESAKKKEKEEDDEEN